MNDKDRELVERVLQAAGDAGSQGWAYLVRWHLLDGVLSFVGCAALLAGVAYLLKRAFAWKPTEDEAYIVRGICIGVLCIFGALNCWGLIEWLRDALAPEGAAVHSALK